MNTEEQKKPGRPALTEVYCVTSSTKTSKGQIYHGDRVKLPQDEAQGLIKRGLVK